MSTLSTTDLTPPKLLGKDFERLILARFQQEEKTGRVTCSRYGVQATMIDGTWTPVQSLPDFEGLLSSGKWFTLEVKVCSAASFAIADDSKFKARQLRHMLTRADFAGISLLVIHFNRRALKTRVDPAQTWAFPVHREHPFWREFDRCEAKSISRLACEEYAYRVHWTATARERNSKPDLVSVLERIA